MGVALHHPCDLRCMIGVVPLELPGWPKTLVEYSDASSSNNQKIKKVIVVVLITMCVVMQLPS